MMNGNVIQSGFENLIWGFSPFLGLKEETYPLFWRNETKPVKFIGARNRLLVIDFGDLMSSINFTQSTVKIQKNHLKLNMFFDTDKLLEKVKQHTVSFDKHLLKQKLAHISFDWKRPLAKEGWRQINDINMKMLDQLTGNQMQEMVQRIHLDSITYQTQTARTFMQNYLEKVDSKNKVLHGEIQYSFKEAFAGLKNLHDYTLLTLNGIKTEMNPSTRFMDFNDTFSRIYLGYLDFILTFVELPEKQADQIPAIRDARRNYQELLSNFSLLEPVKLSPPQIEALLQMTEAL